MIEGLDKPAGGLRFRLRAVTAEAHRKLEYSMAPNVRFQSRESYRALLERLWGIYAPLEAALAKTEWQGAEAFVHQRRKLPWLTADLLYLGLSPTEIESLPRVATLPNVGSVAEVFGVLYVLEGATLGGQVISTYLKAGPQVTEDDGGRFFASYGPETGAKWRAYVQVLERQGPLADSIVRAALNTFECFNVWLGEEAAAAPQIGSEVRVG